MQRLSLLPVVAYLGLSAGLPSATGHPELVTSRDNVLQLCAALSPGERAAAQAGSPVSFETSTRENACKDDVYGPSNNSVWLTEKYIATLSGISIFSLDHYGVLRSRIPKGEASCFSAPVAFSSGPGEKPTKGDQILQYQCAELAMALRHEQQSYRDNSKRAEIASVNTNRVCRGLSYNAACQSSLKEAETYGQLTLKSLDNTEAIRKRMFDVGCSPRSRP